MFEAEEAETQIASGESAIPGHSTVRSGWFASRLVIANQPTNRRRYENAHRSERGDGSSHADSCADGRGHADSCWTDQIVHSSRADNSAGPRRCNLARRDSAPNQPQWIARYRD